MPSEFKFSLTLLKALLKQRKDFCLDIDHGIISALRLLDLPLRSIQVDHDSLAKCLETWYEIYAYGIVGKPRWAHLSTSHHIKPEPLGSA